MKITAYDMIKNEYIELTAYFTTDHPASSYGQAVMLIDEWDGECMSHQNWILTGCRVVEAGEKEFEEFREWARLIDLMAGDGGEYLTTRQAASGAGVSPSRIRQLAAEIPGGIKTEHGWRFPPSAVEFVKAMPKPGPIPKKR